jgi:hypothetical protein
VLGATLRVTGDPRQIEFGDGTTSFATLSGEEGYINSTVAMAAPDFKTSSGTSVNAMLALIRGQQATISSQKDEILAALMPFLRMRSCDPSSATFSTIPTTGVTGDGKYAGAVVVGTRVIFAPLNQNNVGVLDLITGSFTTIPTTGVTGGNKYAGAVAVGTLVFFAPLDQDNVGVLDTVSNTFSTIPTTGVTGGGKYSGTVAVGARVFFAPHHQDNVGVLDCY